MTTAHPLPDGTYHLGDAETLLTGVELEELGDQPADVDPTAIGDALVWSVPVAGATTAYLRDATADGLIVATTRVGGHVALRPTTSVPADAWVSDRTTAIAVGDGHEVVLDGDHLVLRAGDRVALVVTFDEGAPS